MGPVLVAGATGLIGSNVCGQLAASGVPVRALVRPGSESGPLAALGAELVEGDIRSRADVARAAEGVAWIVNCAALLGARDQDLAESRATNLDGSIHCYAAAAATGAGVVELLTTTFFRHDEPLTEDSPVLPADEVADDPYTVTKHAAHLEALARIGQGQRIHFVIPGATFGSAPVPGRAMGYTSFNRLLRAALEGRITEYVTYPVVWVEAASVAAAVVASLDRGRPGATYLAFGAEDARSTAAFLDLACEIAGVPHRVAERRVDEATPELLEQYGATLVDLALRSYPVPWFDNARTRRELDYAPDPLPVALERTIGWMRREGLTTA